MTPLVILVVFLSVTKCSFSTPVYGVCLHTTLGLGVKPMSQLDSASSHVPRYQDHFSQRNTPPRYPIASINVDGRYTHLLKGVDNFPSGSRPEYTVRKAQPHEHYHHWYNKPPGNHALHQSMDLILQLLLEERAKNIEMNRQRTNSSREVPPLIYVDKEHGNGIDDYPPRENEQGRNPHYYGPHHPQQLPPHLLQMGPYPVIGHPYNRFPQHSPFPLRKPHPSYPPRVQFPYEEAPPPRPPPHKGFRTPHHPNFHFPPVTNDIQQQPYFNTFNYDHDPYYVYNTVKPAEPERNPNYVHTPESTWEEADYPDIITLNRKSSSPVVKFPVESAQPVYRTNGQSPTRPEFSVSASQSLESKSLLPTKVGNVTMSTNATVAETTNKNETQPKLQRRNDEEEEQQASNNNSSN